MHAARSDARRNASGHIFGEKALATLLSRRDNLANQPIKRLNA
jgi:hypothetical protein